MKDMEVINNFYKKMIIDYCCLTDKLNKEIQKVKYLSETDHLTKIYNRAKFLELAEKELNRVSRYNSVFSVIILDIDHFKRINDNFGHNTGDHVLQDLTELIQNNLRSSDYFARWGGEEFVIGLTETNLSGTISDGEKIRGIIENHTFDTVKNITISLGAAQYKNKENLESFIERADRALYLAKETGRNCIKSEKDLL